jgi:prepilin-type N-terminal cleavage/methylation domain-containing protein
MFRIHGDRSMCSRRQAFTLVELLVVIGIIAILISVLLPTLSRARESAKKTACLSNMRELGNSFRLYAAANKDAMPIGAVGNNTLSTLEKQFSYVVKWESGGNVTIVSMGHLAMAGLSKSPKTYYCPSEESDPIFVFNSPDNPWVFDKPGVNPLTPVGHHLRFGYNTRPMCAWSIDPATPLPFILPCADYASNVRGLPRQAKMKNKAILSDIVLSPQEVKNRHKSGINVLYANGSAQWMDYKAIENSPMPTGQSWKNIPGSTVSSTYSATMLDESDATKPVGVWIGMDRNSR